VPIAQVEKVVFSVPKRNVSELRKYLFSLSDFHPLELNHEVLGDFGSLKERLERVVSIGSKRKPEIYGSSIFGEKETISSGYIEIGPVLEQIEKVLNEEQELQNRLDVVKKQIADLEPFGWIDSPWEESTNWKWTRVALIKKNRSTLKMVSELPVAWFEGKNALIVVCSSKDEATWEALQEHALDKKLLTNVQEEIQRISHEEKSLQNTLGELEKQIDSLLEENGTQIKKAFDYYSVSLDYARLVNGSVDTQFLGIVAGYLPKALLGDASRKAESLGGTATIVAQEENEIFPTKLENNAFFKPYEPIILMYGPPSYGSFDPTPMVALWWNLFFGFMLGDAGFGLLIMLASLYGILKIKSMKSLARLGLNIGIGTMIVGIITWSWFSTQPFMFNGKALGLFHPLNVNDVNTMLVIALVIGVAAQFYAIGIKGWWMLKKKDYLGFWSDVFCWWGLLSSLIWLLLGGGALSGYFAAFFAVNLILFQGRDSKSWIGRIGMGLIGLYGIISPYGVASFLGDALSYTRLMALNLTGALMGQVFNNLSFSVMKSGIVGMVAGALMFVLFQAFNFAISTLGAFVHSIRLLFLEMYGRFYEGNGESFKPLRKTGRYYEFKEVDYE
jgi:V/A-type H+-transporting ATPase subunit I